jgi:serine/threonine-protein kinase
MTSASDICRALLAIVALVLTCARARAAEPTPAEVTAADALFHEAKELAEKGEYAAACPKLEQSQKLAPGSGTLLNLADCYEQLGRTATAWATFRAAAAAARAKGNADRAEESDARAAALEPRLSRLRIHVAAAVRVPGLLVRRGKVIVDESLWGVAAPVDPGEHTLTVEAPGRRPFRATVTVLATSDVVDFAIPMLAPLSGSPPPEPSSQPVPAPPRVVVRASGEAQRIFAYVLGGVGLAAIGVGLGFGFDALAKNGESEDAGCGADNICSAAGLELRDQAVIQAHVATGLCAAGLAHLVGGLVVLLTAPGDDAEGAVLRVSPAPLGLHLELGATF